MIKMKWAREVMASELQSSYDRLADEYANRIYGELANKPFDRLMLDWLIQKVGGRDTICDLGCGPGQIARYVHDQGAETCGIDLSTGMVEKARALNPGITFQQGDMLALTDVADDSFGGIAAFYCIIHIPCERVGDALRELRRVLKPGGTLLVTFHIGDEIRHVDELWGESVSMDFLFYEREPMKGYLQSAGFTIDEAIERDPYPENVEAQTRRAYIFARKP
jgi:SAM-dependent methyltransferase